MKAALALLLLSTSAMATDLEYAVQGAFIVDWLQTRSITRHPVSEVPYKITYRHEDNPILGSHPSEQRVNLYFPAVMGAHYLLDRQLSRPGQLWFEGGTLVAELLCIFRNRRLGASLSF